jgi:hypothetical protein
VAWLGMCVFKFFRLLRRACTLRTFKRKHPHYDVVPQVDDEEEISMRDGTFRSSSSSSNGRPIKEVELTVAYMRSQSMKRRNSTPDYHWGRSTALILPPATFVGNYWTTYKQNIDLIGCPLTTCCVSHCFTPCSSYCCLFENILFVVEVIIDEDRGEKRQDRLG